MIKRIFFCIGIILLFNICYLFISHILPQPKRTFSPKTDTIKAFVIKAVTSNQQSTANHAFSLQRLTVFIENGQYAGTTLTLDYDTNGTTRQTLKKGDEIILTKNFSSESYHVLGYYRFDRVLYLILGFFLLVLLIAGRKSFGSLFGLCISFCVIIGYIIPQILAGKDPVSTCVFASFIILFVTTYVTHGISKRTSVALTSTFLALLLTIGLSFAAVHVTLLTGYPNEEATDLHFVTLHTINVKGLLLAGIIITTLGALNDITITQATVVFQLAKEKRKLKFINLAKEGFIIGREHALSLINTLVLAYAGSSLSVLIYFFLTPTNQPYWSIISNELVAEEIVKTIAGTTGLIMAVPIVTCLSAYVASKNT